MVRRQIRDHEHEPQLWRKPLLRGRFFILGAGPGWPSLGAVAQLANERFCFWCLPLDYHAKVPTYISAARPSLVRNEHFARNNVDKSGVLLLLCFYLFLLLLLHLLHTLYNGNPLSQFSKTAVIS